MVDNAQWEVIGNNYGFDEYLTQLGNGNYSIKLDTSNVIANVSAYNYNFRIYADGNLSQYITLIITVLLPRTEMVNFTTPDLISGAIPEGFNLTIVFYFNDTLNDLPILDLSVDNITVWDLELGALWSRGFTWELLNHGDGNYTLNISTDGLTVGNQYSIRINITYSGLNPYNYSSRMLDFYYGSSASTPTTNGSGGGGGGGGTKVTGIPFETLVLYIIIIAALVGTVAAIVGVQKGVIAPKKREKERILREVTTIFDHAINLQHILVIYKESGT